ncbi:MAG: hypothetical protein PHN89_00450 [Candidatus Pacebacteria bacterium]|nr:hypothetical protein [Candidatus Paceibacterota bacterium]
MKKDEIKELAIVEEKIAGMREMVDSIKVENDDQLKDISDQIKQVKIVADFIREKKDAYVAPAKDIIAKARETYDPYIEECEAAEVVLKNKAKVYMLDRDNNRRQEELKIAQRVERGTMKPETAVKKFEQMSPAEKTVKSEGGSTLTLKKRSVAVIEKPELIPDEYWIIDEKRVKREALDRAKRGIDQIPGVIIKEEAEMASSNQKT